MQVVQSDLILSSLAASLLGCLDLLLVLLRRFVHLPPPLVIHLLKLPKVPPVEVQLQVMQMDDICRHGVQEIPVVGYHNESLLPSGEVLFQPQHRSEVQVVGGLVKKKHSGLDVEGSS